MASTPALSPRSKRMRVSRRRDAGPYDRFVRLMRLGLPTLAVLILIATAIWPIIRTSESSFIIAREQLPPRSDRVRIANARYVGTDAIDRLFTVTAARALQDEPADPVIELEDLAANMELDAERTATVTAGMGRYVSAEQMLEVQGDVLFQTTDGYRVEAGAARVSLDSKIVRSEAPVSGTSPLGEFTAGGYELDVDQRIATFGGGVRVHITPDRSTTGPEP